ncbi:MAG: NAD-dependent epimerase/dehydratase family protein, partial [Chloroflexota bacterium]
MKVHILGATGFIGGNIARAALENGWHVRGFRRDPDSVGDLGGLDIEWVNGDLNDPDSLRSAMKNVDIVFHAAAFYPNGGRPNEVPSQVKTAEKEISTVIEAIQDSQVRRLIYTSSLTTIGQPPPGELRLADERDIYIPGTLAKSGYYESKIAMEKKVITAAKGGMDAVVLCPTAVFGPGDVHLTLSSMLIAVARGKVPAWLPGDINVIDVREVGAAHIAAAINGRKGERYILGDHNFTIRGALEEAARTAGVN